MFKKRDHRTGDQSYIILSDKHHHTLTNGQDGGKAVFGMNMLVPTITDVLTCHGDGYSNFEEVNSIGTSPSRFRTKLPLTAARLCVTTCRHRPLVIEQYPVEYHTSATPTDPKPPGNPMPHKRRTLGWISSSTIQVSNRIRSLLDFDHTTRPVLLVTVKVSHPPGRRSFEGGPVCCRYA